MADQPMAAVQLTYSPKFGDMQGNYRVYYWNATYHHENSGGATSPDGSGVGVSFDQMITQTFGSFARASYSNKNAYDTDWFWSIGANLKGLIPSRKNDELGIGIASLKGTVGPNNLDSEFHFETYYRIYLTKNFAVSPDIQYVANPKGNTHNEGVFAGMARVTFSF
jgi:carbohydrate-selective porin OprB